MSHGAALQTNHRARCNHVSHREPREPSHYLLLELHLIRRKSDMRATYKLGRDVISKIFRGGGNARYWNEPRSRYEAGSAPGYDDEGVSPREISSLKEIFRRIPRAEGL